MTEEQQSQTALSAKTLRAAVLLSLAFVGSVLTARTGCSDLAALATAKIPRRRPRRNFQTGSKARERAERRRWMALWKPALDKVYGPSPDDERWRDDPSFGLPSLPGSRTQHAVEREWAGWDFWMAAGRLALARHQQRRPHAIPSLSRLARLIQIGSDFGRLACGLDTGPAASPAPSDVPDFEKPRMNTDAPDGRKG